MNFRLYLLLIILLTCFAACARKEKAVVDLSIEKKVIDVKYGEIRLDDVEGKTIVTSLQSSQLAPQRMSDNSEVAVMFDGFGNKLERRYFKGHPRINSIIVRTAADGRKEIIIYGYNGERKSVDGELVDRLMTASADEIASAAKIYATRPIIQTRKAAVENEQTKPETPVLPPVILPPPPDVIQQDETTVEEQIKETPENGDSTQNSSPKEQKEASAGKKEDEENR